MSQINLECLGNRIVFKEIIKEEKTVGGIIIAKDEIENRTIIGDVVNVGPGRYLENGTLVPPGVSVGDRVVIPKFAITTVSIDGNHFSVCTANDIIAKVATC